MSCVSRFCVCLAIFALIGCDRLSKEEVTANSPLWGGYSQGSVYELKQNVFMVKLEDKNEGTRNALSPEGLFDHPDRFYTVPRSIEKYKQEGGKLAETDLVTGRAYQLPTTIVEVINTGVSIKCTSLIKYEQWTWFFGKANWVTVYGEILEGPRAGTSVDLTDLSVRNSIQVQNEETAIYQPNPRLLKLKSP